MSFIDFPSPTPIFPVLPPLAWSVHKKPVMASRVTTSMSGRETQLACAVFPRWSFTLSYGGTNSWLREQTQNIVPDPDLSGFTELEQISQLFIACLGAYGEFYYEDPDDNSRMGEGIGFADGTLTIFPIQYTWGTGPFSPSMTIPVGGINTIDAVYFDGVAQSPLIYSLDAERTSLVFTSAPARGVVITADFHFYFRCRFLEDQMDYSQWAKNLWEVKEVKFESVKP